MKECSVLMAETIEGKIEWFRKGEQVKNLFSVPFLH